MTGYTDDLVWKTTIEMLRQATSVHKDHEREMEIAKADREIKKMELRNADKVLIKYWEEMVNSMAKDAMYIYGDIDFIPKNVPTNYNDEQAIKRQRGKHWQTKTEPESTLYYTRLCDGNYRRIGDSEELPEGFRGSLITNMAIDYNRMIKQIHGKDVHKRMLLTEDALPDYIQCDSFLDLKNSIKELSEKVVKSAMTNATTKELVEVTAEDVQNVASLIDRRTARLAREAKHYTDAFHNERKLKEELIIENRLLKEEIAHLKRVGRFPVDNAPPKEASDREKRFLSIDV